MFKGMLVLLAGFVLFFAFRLIYGYVVHPKSESYNNDHNSQTYYNNSDEQNIKRNYATSKYKESKEAPVQNAANPQQRSVDQKYEKVGTINAQSGEFEQTEQKVRTSVKKYNALIQYEQKSGLPGQRSLNLVIGVPPQHFDSIVGELKKYGKVTSIAINKTDKTNEYKVLNANRASTEKTIASLYSLKEKGGKIDEFINLENRIMELEETMQNLGVKLGDFDEENEFCTVKYSLVESEKKDDSIPFLYRVKVALEWTIKYYGVFMILSAFGALLIFFVVKIAVALKWIKQ